MEIHHWTIVYIERTTYTRLYMDQWIFMLFCSHWQFLLFLVDGRQLYLLLWWRVEGVCTMGPCEDWKLEILVVFSCASTSPSLFDLSLRHHTPLCCAYSVAVSLCSSPNLTEVLPSLSPNTCLDTLCGQLFTFCNGNSVTYISFLSMVLFLNVSQMGFQRLLLLGLILLAFHHYAAAAALSNACKGMNLCNETVSTCRDTPTSYICDCKKGYEHPGTNLLICKGQG